MSDEAPKQYCDINDYTGYSSDDDPEERYGQCNALQQAAKNGDLDAVIAAVPTTDINENNYRRWNALNLAALNNHWDIVEYLIKQKASIENYTTDAFHITPLHYAVLYNNPTQVASLLQNKAAVKDVYDANGVSVLHTAIKNKSIDVLQLLINAPDVDINVISQKRTPLSYAIVQNYLPAFELLQTKGDAQREKTSDDAILRDAIDIARTPATLLDALFAVNTIQFSPQELANGLYALIRKRGDQTAQIEKILTYAKQHNIDVVNTPIALTSSFIELIVGFDQTVAQKLLAGQPQGNFTPFQIASIAKKYVAVLNDQANTENVERAQQLVAQL